MPGMEHGYTDPPLIIRVFTSVGWSYPNNKYAKILLTTRILHVGGLTDQQSRTLVKFQALSASYAQVPPSPNDSGMHRHAHIGHGVRGLGALLRVQRRRGGSKRAGWPR